MADMFNQEWATGFAGRWNNTKAMTEPLGQANFNSVMGFGYKDEEQPRVVVEVENGKIVTTGLYAPGGKAFDWDLRASPEQWETWRKAPLTIMGLGVAVARGNIQFKSGDYRGMIRQMHLAKPFLHFFTIL